MWHKSRRWTVDDVATAEELAEKLTGHSWCLCNGFKLGGYLFLNDATSEDGGAEFSVVKADKPEIQVETITFSWCSREQALKYIQSALAGEFDGQTWVSGIDAGHIQDNATHGTCHHCA